MKERREYLRVALTTSVQIFSLERGEFICEGLTKNICMVGMAAVAGKELDANSGFEFVFSLPGDKLIRTKGFIIWQSPSNDSFIYGIRFAKLSIFNWIKLLLFIRKQLKQVKHDKVS